MSEQDYKQLRWIDKFISMYEFGTLSVPPQKAPEWAYRYEAELKVSIEVSEAAYAIKQEFSKSPRFYADKITYKDYLQYVSRSDEPITWSEYHSAQCEWFAASAEFTALESKWGFGLVWDCPEKDKVNALCDTMRDIEFLLGA